MKKKIAIIAGIVILLAIIATGTMAFVSESDIAHNVITSSAVKVSVVETMRKDGKEITYVDPADPLVPGDNVSKIVRVRNEDAESYIRVKVTITAAKDKKTWTPDPDEIGITMNTKAWTEKDGYWYCNTPVAEDALTEPLFQQVALNGAKMGNEYQGAAIDISIKAQGVQTANNGTSALTAKGWPLY